MEILKALGFEAGQAFAFTGSGGKTTAIFALARLLQRPAIVTTTTHLGLDQADLADRHIILEPHEAPDFSFLDGEKGMVLLVTGPVAYGEKLQGLPADRLQMLWKAALGAGFSLLIEADGSRKLPLKAPGDHEPVVPAWVHGVVLVAGLAGLDGRISKEVVHRPGIFAALAGVPEGRVISPQVLARVLGHENGGRKGLPPDARHILLLNQADTPKRQAQARRIASLLGSKFDRVVSASMAQKAVHAVYQRTAGVILAAGASTRLGQPKQLLDWRGRPLVRHAVQTALEAGLEPVIVVLGASGDRVADALAGMPVELVENRLWQIGQSTSVKKGLSAVPVRCGAALFMLVDQPFAEAVLIRRLTEHHAKTLAPVVAPLIDGERGNPVLFDRRTFDNFADLEGDAGARQIFSRYRVEWLPWHDSLAGEDIDTMEDYHRLLDSQNRPPLEFS